MEFVLVYTIHEEHGFVTRACGPFGEEAMLVARADLFDKHGAASCYPLQLLPTLNESPRKERSVMSGCPHTGHAKHVCGGCADDNDDDNSSQEDD